MTDESSNQITNVLLTPPNDSKDIFGLKLNIRYVMIMANFQDSFREK